MAIVPKKLKRNPTAIAAQLKKAGSSVVALQPLKIIFPMRYVDKGLANIGNTVSALSVLAIIDNNGNYSVINAMSMPEFSPHTVIEEVIDNVGYYVMEFDAGDVVIVKEDVVKNDTFIYDFFDEFIVKANIPWYLDYGDVGNLLSTAKQYAGSGVAKNPIGIEILSATIARDPNDKTVFFRHAVNKDKGMLHKRPSFVGLFNVYSTFKNTTNKLSGSYMRQGITSAIVNPEEDSSALERALRA